MSVKYDIKGIAFIGRTAEEYLQMFSLTLKELAGKSVLDFPGGACSFTTELAAHGIHTSAADPLYGRPASELETRCQSDYQRAMAAFDKIPLQPELLTSSDASIDYASRQPLAITQSGVEGLFRLKETYGTLDHLRRLRRQAYTTFLQDYQQHPQRYLQAQLPKSPFRENQFDLVLSGHYLFLYGDRLDYDFHLNAILELCRIAKEVRIFPLQGFDAKPYPHLNRLLDELRRNKLIQTIKTVPFEFIRGGNKVLCITKETR